MPKLTRKRMNHKLVNHKLANHKLMNNTWQDWCIAIAGFWLIASPQQLGFALDHYASGNACGVGALLVIYNVMIVGRLIDEGQEFFNLILGIWLIFSPYALSFSWIVSASVNTIAVGAAIVLLSSVGLYRSSRKPS